MSGQSSFGDPEVPEADALDQEREVEPGPVDDEPTLDPEVDEGDALEHPTVVRRTYTTVCTCTSRPSRADAVTAQPTRWVRRASS